MFPIEFSHVFKKNPVFLSTLSKFYSTVVMLDPITVYKIVKVQSQSIRNTVNGIMSIKQVTKSSTNIPNFSLRIMKKWIL